MTTQNVTRTGGPARAGTLESAAEWASGKPRFRGRVRLADGTKSHRFDVPEGFDQAGARKWLAGIQADEDRQGLILGAKRDAERASAAQAGEACEGETCDAWYARRPARTEDRSRWRKWIAPHIGGKPMASVTRDDVEAVRDALDVALRAGRAQPRTMLGAWATLTSSFRMATNSKDRSLRILGANPCLGVLPPDNGEGRRRSWLYPVEVARLLECAAVPLAARRLYALAVYLYLRPGELAALEWSDVDLVGGVVRVTKAHDWTTGECKPPKTRNGIRTVPIAPSLRPLLQEMHEQARGACDKASGRVVPMFSKNDTAKAFRADLQTAGVDRAELYTLTPTTEPIDFRSCRDSGITWLALAGVDVVKMQRRAGHDGLETTMRYCKVAEDFTGTVGEPFPALPPALLGALNTAGIGPAIGPGLPASSMLSDGYGRTRWRGLPVDAQTSDTHLPVINELADSEVAEGARCTPETGGFGPGIGPAPSLEDALAMALARASSAGAWDVVAQLARELEARRLQSAGVRTLADLAARRRG